MINEPQEPEEGPSDYLAPSLEPTVSQEAPADHPAPSMELHNVYGSTKSVNDISCAVSSRDTADEEAPVGSKPFVEPKQVLEVGSQKVLTPGKRAQLGRLSSTVININQLPNDVADNLRPYDINGDGMISLTELVHGAMTQQEQQEKVRLVPFIT